MYDWELPQVLDSFFFLIPPSVEETKTMFKPCSEPSRALIKVCFFPPLFSIAVCLWWGLGTIEARSRTQNLGGARGWVGDAGASRQLARFQRASRSLCLIISLL